MSRRVNCCNFSLFPISCHFCYLFLIFIYFFALITTANLEDTEQEQATAELFSIQSLKQLLDALLLATNFSSPSSSSSVAENNSKNTMSSSVADLLCNAQENSMCENARMCRRRENATDFECVCRRGHAGKYCQFSLFPRNCADAFAFHEEELGEEHILDVGVWQLDVDGSAPLPPTYAECKMVDGVVVTVVSNNVPHDGAIVRTKLGTGPADSQNVFFPISYRLFSSSQLSALISRSYICKQNIRFDCEHSTLGFKENRTWMEVVSHDGKQHRQIGTHQQFSCACRNKELYGCGRDNPALACYCDDLAQPSAIDQATLYNASAGVSAIYFRASKGPHQKQQQHQKQKHNNNGAQNFTLGPLECSGEAGTSLPAAVVTLRSPSAGIGTGTVGQWRQLEFDFRTEQPHIEQIVAGWDPTDNGLQMKISLRAGNRFELTLSHQTDIEQTETEKSAESDDTTHNNDHHKPLVHQQKRGIRREMSVSIASQRPLNDLFWHRVLVEVFRGEIRFSVDRLNAFQPLSFPFATSTKFTIGGDDNGNGFVGCIGNFQIDQTLHDWTQQLAQKEKDEDVRVVSGCLELCAENKCEQGSKCVEHFDTETTSCACKLPRIHYGEYCEKNINENSSVTFRGGSSGFLRFFNLPVSALHSDVLFSVRTDQRRALLLYEHDQADNFVQVHLADEYQIVLTMNNLSSIVSCSIFAPPTKTFNDMRWLQFILERSNGPISGTTAAASSVVVLLHVDDGKCQIGPVLMNDPTISSGHQNGPMDEKTAEDDDAILPPAPPVPPEKARPFHILFVGGMPRAKRTIRQTRERMPVYLSNLPPLRGCVRGLMVDEEKVDMWAAVTELKSAQNGQWDAVEIGCDHLQCDANLQCQNGGQCAVNWRNIPHGNNRQPTKQQCDCTKSSFVGTNCTEDVGLSFVGNSAVVFDISEPKRFAFLQQSERQTLSFAFSCAKNGAQRFAQQLATIYFEDGREFHIVLDKNGTLFVGIFGLNSRSPIVMQQIAHSFKDGFRHHFRVHFLTTKIQLELAEPFGPRRIWTIKGEGITLANARQFYLGGPNKIGEKTANDSNLHVEDKSSDSGSGEGGQHKHLQNNHEQNANDHLVAPTNDHNNANANNADSMVLADAMREILARRSANANGQNINLKIGQTASNLAKASASATTLSWPKQIEHFVGCISNVLIVFESDKNVLTFTPFLYYLQKSELLHRNVFVVPSDSQQPLAPMACGQFKVPELAKKARRNVTFPVWEAPFGPIVFHDNDVSYEKLIKNDLTDEASDETGNSFVRWLFLIVLLVILLALFLFLITLICRQTIRQQIGRTYYVLQKTEPKSRRPTFEVLKTNGQIKKRRFGSRSDSMEPIQLAQHKRFFPLEGTFSGTPPITPSAPLLSADQAQPEQKPILPHFHTSGILSPSITITAPPQSAFETDGTATASSSTIYYTAQEEQIATDNSSSTISFKSLDDQTGSGDEDSTTIGQAFEENAPELMDERTRQLSAALSSSYGGSSNFSFGNLMGEAEKEKRNNLPRNL